jgi:hypothetical protein
MSEISKSSLVSPTIIDFKLSIESIEKTWSKLQDR